VKHLFFVALAAVCAGAQDPPPFSIPAKQLVQLESAAQLLAREGWADEAGALIAIMKSLGYPEAKAEKLLQTCKPQKGKKRAPVPQIAKSLKVAVQQIASAVPPDARAVAEALLLIDGSVESLHKILLREKTAEGWKSPEDVKAAARKSEITLALTKARRIMPEIVASEGEDPVIKEIYGTACNVVSSQGVAIYSRWSAEKLRRVLTESLRATAVSNYLLKGEVAIPKLKENYLILETRKDYDRAIEIALAKGWIKPESVEDTKKLDAFWADRIDLPRYEVRFEQVECEAEAGIHFASSFGMGLREVCPPLRVGHINWVSLAYLGAPMPGVAWTEEKGKKERKTASGVLPEEQAERERIMKLAEAGIAGSRSWMAYLVARGEDPAFARSIVDQDGKIEGDDRLKCTLVAEFLHLHGEYLSLAEKTAYGTRESFEQAWGSLAAFESRWRSWISGARPSLVERIDPPKPKPPSPQDADVITRLNDHRRRCFKGSVLGDAEPADAGTWPTEILDDVEVSMDEELSSSARKHALYLLKNPAQLEAWPDAHEEWPDKPGFSPEGGFSGTHSVIFPGVTTPEMALNGWLGTFYHRLPLIHPGLLRIGWGFEGKVAVLDSGSIVRPLAGPWHVVWPYDGMTDVPVHFSFPELPNPVPGVDQSTFGYPVTLQTGAYTGTAALPTIALELREGGEKGPEVICHVSTPAKPSNPDLSPSDAWCLVPKAPLKPSTTYFARATWSNGRKFSWTFKTGRS
jgi:hypothetical protein